MISSNASPAPTTKAKLQAISDGVNQATDGDGIPNYLDDDTDDDGIPDYLDSDAPRTDLVLTMEARQLLHSLTYTITVRNQGALTATGAIVSDTLPAAYENPTCTCTATGGATCTASGSGSISDTVTMPAGSMLVYIVKGTTRQRFLNTAEVIPPRTLNDMVPRNNRVALYNVYQVILPLVYKNYTP